MARETSPPPNEGSSTHKWRDLFCNQKWNTRHPKVDLLYEKDLSANTLLNLFRKGNGKPIAISYGYVPCNRDTLLKSKDACLLSAIAISCADRVLCIELDYSGEIEHTVLNTHIFNEEIALVGIDLNRLVLGLYHCYGLEARVVDLLSLSLQPPNITEPSLYVLCERYSDLDEDVVVALFNDFAYDGTSQTIQNLVERAWVVWALYDNAGALYSDLEGLPMTELGYLTHEERLTLAQLVLNVDRLQAQQPDYTEHRVEGYIDGTTVQLKSQEFSSRVRSGYNGRIKIMEFTLEDGTRIKAELKGVRGRDAEPEILAENGTDVDMANAGLVQAAKTLGRQDPTSLEGQRTRHIYELLQGKLHFSHNRALYRLFSQSHTRYPEGTAVQPSLQELSYGYIASLNRSQQTAVRSLLAESEDLQVSLIHGPPGTGKTSVLVAQTEKLLELFPDSAVWLVAQSNVAVKNIAEKLLKVKIAEGQWKIIVSDEFHNNWHEEMYVKMRDSETILTSNDLKAKRKQGKIRQTFAGIKVILCTLTMLTAGPLRATDLHKLLPPHSLIVDEASQITMSDFLPSMCLLGGHIQRLGFVGDPKQLAPYGSDETPGLQSIFEAVKERPCIADKKVLLNITYRLPLHLAHAISSHVYSHTLFDRFASDEEQRYTAIRFINVADSEEERVGTSYTNPAEAEVCLEIAKLLSGKEFKIITPYNGQTTLIDKKLKEDQDLPMEEREDKCNNVDSFQGNEADFIIISITRSKGLGFLENRRRTNVMLTRCKRAMFIVTNRKFLLEKAWYTLVGSIAAEWSGGMKPYGWIESTHLDKLEIENL